MQTLSVTQTQTLLADGAILVDIRGAEEYAREHIENATHIPHTQLQPGQFDRPVVFHCKSGQRTQMYAQHLQNACRADAYCLEGGIEAWKKAGLPVKRDHRQPIELQRQVQIAAGSLILLGVCLGAWVHTGFYALAGFVGAGLIFAGISGFCGMARLLAKMPWNQRQP